MSNTVHVKGISSQTSEKEVKDFFSFCGKIQNLSITPDSNDSSSTQSASVTFEKETAAKTALLLDNTQLGPAQVHVSAASSIDQIAGDKAATSGDEPHGDNITQEDKPRSRIVAEYLAHGYVISDKAIERALTLDQQHGVSNRFMTTLNNLNEKYKVGERAGQMDERYGVSKTAQQGWLGLTSYFDKAMGTPTGQRVRAFYDNSQKQVVDVHNEAKHLASLKSGKPEASVMDPASSEKPNPSATLPTPEQAEMEKVEIAGQERTKCNCGGADGKCPCPPGQCACDGCSKAQTSTSTT